VIKHLATAAVRNEKTGRMEHDSGVTFCYTTIKDLNSTPFVDQVTCKRCLKMSASIEAELAEGTIQLTN